VKEHSHYNKHLIPWCRHS